MANETPNYLLSLPIPLTSADANVWGDYLNGNTEFVDTYSLALANNFISNSPPTIVSTGNPARGQFWFNSTTAPIYPLSVYDGTNWVQMGTLNATSHTFNANSGGVNIIKITANTTYTPSVGISYAIIECWGGGAGGGGIASNPGVIGGAGGGGAGSYSKTYAIYTALTPNQTVMVGNAGTGGSTGATGGSGGNTSVGALCLANGGQGGQGSAGQFGRYGAGGGSGTGNIIAAPGQSGGTAGGGTGITAIAVSGFGGNTIVGEGGGGAEAGASSANVGVSALGFGAGGSGAAGANGTGNSGGNGTPGYVIITEFF